MKKNLGGGVNDFRHSTLLILGTHLRSWVFAYSGENPVVCLY